MTISRETSEAGRKPPLTTANVNKWCKSVLADPVQASLLKENWVKLLLSRSMLQANRPRASRMCRPLMLESSKKHSRWWWITAALSTSSASQSAALEGSLSSRNQPNQASPSYR
jgi:hypothetical protein